MAKLQRRHSVGIGTATGTNSWTITSLHLQTGNNVIYVTAWDAAGNSTNTILTVTLSVAVPNYTITLWISPTNGGTVSGAGTFSAGSTRTVTAMPNSGYTFFGWSENELVKSFSPDYVFTLNTNRNLVANFIPAINGYPGAVWAGPAAASNYETGRSGSNITYIILHTTEGSMAAALSRFQTSGQQASSHYIIGTNGAIWQVVSDADTAYHCGNLAWNRQSIGIELEGWADGNPAGNFSWQTDAQRTTLENLINWLHSQYGVPLDRAHIVGHNQVPSPGGSYPPPTEWGGASNHHDPGAWFNWRRLMTDLGHAPTFTPVTVQSATTILTLPQAGAPIIMSAAAGQKFIAYDSYNGYDLVFLSGNELPQSFLGSGEYHWDGWIPVGSVAADPNAVQLEVTNGFPSYWLIHSGASLSSSVVAHTIDGKRYVATGNTAVADGHTWREFYIATTNNTVATGWAVADGLDVIGNVLPPPDQLTGYSMSNGVFNFILNGQAGSNYVIFVLSDLVYWMPLSTNTIPAQGLMAIS